MSKKVSFPYKIIKGLVRFFYGKMEVEGLENVPEQDAIIVANHSQMHGPIACELFLPEDCYTWCDGIMMEWKKVPAYAYQEFWGGKPKWTKPFYKVLSYIIVPFAACIFGNARVIAVYRDMRIMSTFKDSIRKLEAGERVVIFPERHETRNNILFQFHENFIDLAKLYYKKTGRALTFVPMYIAPALKKMYIGEGIVYNPEKPIEEERTRIAECIADAITKTARELPEHRVVPFDNISKKQQITNKDNDKVPV